MKIPSYFKSVFALTFFVYSLLASSYILPSFLLRSGFGVGQAGVLMSVFFVGATLARPLAGMAVERFGVRRVIVVSALVGALAGLSYLFGSFAALFAGRFAVGVCYSLIYVAVMSYQALAIPAEARGRAFSYLCLASMMPQFFVVPLSELLIDGGAAPAFLLLSTVILAFLAVYAVRLPGLESASQSAGERKEWGTWSELLSRRDTWSLLLSIFTLSLAANAAVQYVPNLVRQLGLKGTIFTWSLSPSSIVVRLTFCTWMLTFFDRRSIFCFWALMESVALLWASCSGGTAAFILSGILFGVSHGFDYPAINALLPDVIPPRLLPKGSALYLLANDLPPILLPLIIGAAPQSMGLSGVLRTIGFIAIAAFPLLYWFMWRHPPLRAQSGGGRA